MPAPRSRHLHPLEDRFPVEEPELPPGLWLEPPGIAPEEDQRFSEWHAFEQRTTGDNGGWLWEEPRWEEPPAHLLERLAGRLRRKRTGS